jgi:ketosteroid isomerase-like protein
MPSQHESPALRVARAHVEAWSEKDWDTARSLLSPDVHVTATHAGPYPPPTDLTGADDYMKGLAAFAEPIVAGSVRELAGVGDDRNALITLDLQAAFDPSGPAVAAPCARLYLVENGKIKTEQVVFYVGRG